MQISNAGIELISRFEGCRLNAYKDPVGILTIGIGHTGADVHPGQVITRKQAFDLLRKDSSNAAAQVGKMVKKPLSQGQFDALVSLVFNAGAAPLHGTLGSQLNDGNFDGAAAEFPKWCHGTMGGKLVVLPGLVTRRAAEQALFKGSSTAHDPLAVVNKNEKHWVSHYDALVDGGKGDSPEAKSLQEKMRRQRKVIWRLAQPKAQGGDGNGWHFRHRLERYRLLVARTN